MTDKEKEFIIQELWLIYFNDTLRSKGLITEDVWRKMHTKIINRKQTGGKNERN